MAHKTLLFLGLTLAFVLLIASEVAARDLAETTTEKTTEETTEPKGLEEAKYGGGEYGGGDGYGGKKKYCYKCCNHGYCKKCCRGETANNVETHETKPQN